MKRLIGFIAILIVLACASCGSLQQAGSHFKSSMVKLPRVITLYACDGSVIQQWDGRYKVEVESSSARFIHEGKAIYISGIFSIVEK